MPGKGKGKRAAECAPTGPCPRAGADGGPCEDVDCATCGACGACGPCRARATPSAPPRKKRNRVRPAQLVVLEARFAACPGPDTADRREIARQLGEECSSSSEIHCR
jgi:hypothetical protein